MTHLINILKQNKYQHFIVKTLMLLFIVIVMDNAIGAILKHYYFKQTSGFLYRTTYAIEKSNADILIFGSSRAMHHYVSDVFEKKTKMTCYNLGAAGQSFYYHYSVYKAIKKRYLPKIIYYDFKYFEFIESKRDDERITSLLPYYYSYPEIQPIIEKRLPYENIKMISKIYPYNSMILKIVIANMEFNKRRVESEEDIKGYVPLSKTWTDPVWTDTAKQDYKIDNQKVIFFEEFMEDCHKSGIRLILVVSPYYNKQTNPDPSFVLGRDLSNKHNTEFYDFTNETHIVSNPNLFSDPIHMNHLGAETFTGIIIDKTINPKGDKVSDLTMITDNPKNSHR